MQDEPIGSSGVNRLRSAVTWPRHEAVVDRRSCRCETRDRGAVPARPDSRATPGGCRSTRVRAGTEALCNSRPGGRCESFRRCAADASGASPVPCRSARSGPCCVARSGWSASAKGGPIPCAWALRKKGCRTDDDAPDRCRCAPGPRPARPPVAWHAGSARTSAPRHPSRACRRYAGMESSAAAGEGNGRYASWFAGVGRFRAGHASDTHEAHGKHGALHRERDPA